MSQTHRRPAAPRRRMEPKYVKRRQRGLAVLIAAIVLIIGAIVYIGVRLSVGGNDFEGQGNGVVQLVQVKEGESMSELGPQLVEKKIVKSEDAFASAAFLDPSASAIKPGLYRLQEEMSATAAVKALLDDANLVDFLDVPGGATLSDVTVVAGQTREGIYHQISDISCVAGNADCVSIEQLQDVAATADPASLGVPAWAVDQVTARAGDPRRLEGLIRPGQYVIDPGMSAEEILRDLLTRSADYWQSTDIVGRAQAIGLSPYELLTAASLVEREAPAGEFAKVARVILNRLAAPMRLEFDSTVNYGLSEQEVATTDEDRARVTPWNTYAMEGLPQTPIAAASDDAILAMEHPADGDWLFFVTIDSDGTTVFNNTYEEHLADVERAQESGVLDSNR